MKWLFCLLCCLTLVACKEQKSNNEVSLDDITSGTTSDYDVNKAAEGKIIIPHYYDSVSKEAQLIVDSMLWEKTAVFLLDTIIFPDRFGAKKSEKWYSLTQNDSVVVMHWTFGNALQAENALFNWLDCWGKTCQSFSIGTPAKLGRNSVLMLQADKELYCIEAKRKIDGEKWAELLQHAHQIKTWKFAFLQLPKQQINWDFLQEIPVKLP